MTLVWLQSMKHVWFKSILKRVTIKNLELRADTDDTVKEYLKQLRESMGYDVDFAPEHTVPFVPLDKFQGWHFDFYDSIKEDVAEFASEEINECMPKNYNLLNVEKAVLGPDSMMLLTFTASEDADEECACDCGCPCRKSKEDARFCLCWCECWEGLPKVVTFQARVFVTRYDDDFELEEWGFKPVAIAAATSG